MTTLICDKCGMTFTEDSEFMNHKCSPMKIEQDEKDIKSFEEWWNREGRFIYWGNGSIHAMREAWLASRRKLREKEGKNES